MPVTFTIISSDVPRRLTKHITLHEGVLKTEAGGMMSRGTYQVKTVEDLQEFSEVLSGMRKNEALAFGIPNGPRAGTIVTKDDYDRLPEEQRTGYVSRSNDHFFWPEEPGIFMIDIDPPKDGPALSKEDAIQLIRSVAPELRNVPMLWYPSSSSFLYSVGGEELSGLRGQRLYVPVSNARDIPALADALWTRCWAMGHGRISISKSGQILKRTVFDKAVYQPCRLDFAAGASTGPGLVQKRGEPEVV